MNTILLGHTYDIEGVGPAVIDKIRSINGEARIKAFPLGAGDVPADDGLPGTNVFEWLKTEISAVDLWYRGDPSYEHDAYWLRERVYKLIDDARAAFPAALASVPQPAKDGWREALPAGVLCYVAGETAYFTTRTLDEQWGDDWNDAPYEHNAGPPYEWREGSSSEAPYQIAILKFSGPFSTPADIAGSNSRYSVQMINSGACAWLVADDPKYRSIPAGITAAQFADLMQAAGGTVYLAATLSPTEQAAPAVEPVAYASEKVLTDLHERKDQFHVNACLYRHPISEWTIPLYRSPAALSQPSLAQGGVTEAERPWPACLDPNASHNRRSAYKEFRRSQIAQLRPYEAGEDLAGVSISAPDKDAGSPKVGDMIARNPKNHADKWLVAAQYFADNFEPLAALSAPSAPVEAIRVTRLIWDGGTAKTPVGIYNFSVDDRNKGRVALFYNRQFLDWFADVEAAKAAAQADYERRILAALQAAPVQQQTWRPTHRHVKTGGEYMLLGIGKMQSKRWQEQNPHGALIWNVDMREVAIYRGADGSLWVRPIEEFNNGRFVPLPTNSEASSNG
ncbi:MAG: hypothetical protein WC047_05200 [Kiritimatiellales bacterium]